MLDLKMISISTCTAVLFAFMFPTQIAGIEISVDQTPLVATCSADTAAQVFSSLVFIDFISAHNPEVVFGLRLPSDVAAKRIYDVNLRLFKLYGVRNAQAIASTVYSAIVLVDEFTLPLYLLNIATSFGEMLVNIGVLSCDNAIERATEYFGYEQDEFQLLDSTQLESYVTALVKGLADILIKLGFNEAELDDKWQLLADLVYNEYSKYASLPHAYPL